MGCYSKAFPSPHTNSKAGVYAQGRSSSFFVLLLLLFHFLLFFSLSLLVLLLVLLLVRGPRRGRVVGHKRPLRNFKLLSW